MLIDDVYASGKADPVTKYPLLSEAVKEGFLHPNCRRPITTHFEGISSIPESSDYDQTRKNYEAEQRQRYLERRIRRAKRKQLVAQTPEAKAEADAELEYWQSRMREHLKQNFDFRRKPEREKIYSAGAGVDKQSQKVETDDKIKASEQVGTSSNKKTDRIKQIIRGHDSTPRGSLPNSQIDKLDDNEQVIDRTYYDSAGLKRVSIHTTDHGNPRQHPYGIKGEHVTEFEWNDDGSLKRKFNREITDQERSENADLFE